MNPYAKITAIIAECIDSEVRSLGFEPADFYRMHGFRTSMWRMRNAQSFESATIKRILETLVIAFDCDSKRSGLES